MYNRAGRMSERKLSTRKQRPRKLLWGGVRAEERK